MPKKSFRENYGAATLSPTEVTAGSFVKWTVKYEVGKLGMDDGSSIKIASRMMSDWGPPQFENPDKKNYTTAKTTGDAKVECKYQEKGYIRPYSNSTNVRVYDGSLAEGETITLTLGNDDREGMRFQAPTYPEKVRVPFLVDPFGTGEFVELPEDLEFKVIPDDATYLKALLKSEAKVGEKTKISIRAEDRWGNVSTNYSGSLKITNAETGDKIRSVEASEGTAETLIAFSKTGVHRINVEDEKKDLKTTTNPSVIEEDEDYKTFWGDLHGQSGETVGTGTVKEYFDFGKNKAFLDFIAHQGNDFQITDQLWEEIKSAVKEFHKPGEYVTFLGYEWSANTPNGGDHNLYFLEDEAEINRSSSWQIKKEFQKHKGLYPIEKLYDHYKGREDVMIIPHQGGRPAKLKVLDPELTPLVEILSVWGVFEWFGQEALERGHPVGFIAGSDDHTGRPGATYPTNHPDLNIKGGLIAAKAKNLTRESLWNAFKNRRCYATTGTRILLKVQIDGSGMGEEVKVEGKPEVNIEVHGTAPIQGIDLFRKSKLLKSQEFTEGREKLEFSWSGARSNNRHKTQNWDGKLTLNRGKISSVEEFGFDHPDQGIKSAEEKKVEWISSTSGNRQGIRFELDADEDSEISFKTPPVVEKTFRVGELKNGIEMEKGFLDKKIKIKQVGKAMKKDVSTKFEDQSVRSGSYPYYVRVRQENGEMAWSSPIFVTVE